MPNRFASGLWGLANNTAANVVATAIIALMVVLWGRLSAEWAWPAVFVMGLVAVASVLVVLTCLRFWARMPGPNEAPAVAVNVSGMPEDMSTFLIERAREDKATAALVPELQRKFEEANKDLSLKHAEIADRDVRLERMNSAFAEAMRLVRESEERFRLARQTIDEVDSILSATPRPSLLGPSSTLIQKAMMEKPDDRINKARERISVYRGPMDPEAFSQALRAAIVPPRRSDSPD